MKLFLHHLVIIALSLVVADSYAQNPVDSMVFYKDYFPGQNDINGRYLGSTETMAIVQHKGKLYAGMGNWMDYPITLQHEGTQVLRKDSYNSPWVVDTSVGYTSLRSEALVSVYFDKDMNGQTLNPPVNVLVGGFSDIIQPRIAGIWVRNDSTGQWYKNNIFQLPGGEAGVRSFALHTDKVSGKQYLFAGISAGSIVKAEYTGIAPGFISIDTTQELQGLGRVMAMCVCNGDLYASAGVDLVGTDTVGGLYRRIDGINPAWQLVYRWPYTPSSGPDESNIFRGITCISDPLGSGNKVIIGTRSKGAMIQIVEPFNNHQVRDELHITAYFGDALFAGTWPFADYTLCAYNNFLPDTLDGQEFWWAGVGLISEENTDLSNNGAYFLQRSDSGNYRWGYIHDADHSLPLGKSLRATRTICKSPFPEDEGKVYYFGGYDAASDTSNNTAWIYKGALQAPVNQDTFLFKLTYAHDYGLGQATTLLDINGDTLLDFVTANKGRIHVVENLGAGQFEHQATYTVDNANGFGAYDLNGDGRLDFSIAQEQGQLNDNWLNLGNGLFDPVDSGNESVGSTRDVVYADFDNDGHVDSYHSASAFGNNRQGNQLHAGLAGGLFGPDLIETVLDPPVPGFWYDSLTHPVLGPQYWSAIQSKGVVVRDFDGDGRADIVNAVYCDLGFQPDMFTQQWVNQQQRGLFLLKNNSEPGQIRFEDVSLAALGPDAHGNTTADWNAYAPVPLDYDRDGDYDLIVGATMRQQENTDLIRLYENISSPGNIAFVEKTSEAGLQYVNNLPVGTKQQLNLAAGIPIDADNDGWTDFAFVNRKDGVSTFMPNVILFRNNGDNTFSLVPYGTHGLGGQAGGRDINLGDLDRDGRMDILLSDGTVGGYEGTDSTLVYLNRVQNNFHWIQLDIKTSPGETWAFDRTVKVFRAGTNELLGMDDIRTELCYRSKRFPVLQFGLGTATAVDVEIIGPDTTYLAAGLEADQVHFLTLDQLTTEIDEPAPAASVMVYPNPTVDRLYVKGADSPGRFEIRDITGRMLARGNWSAEGIPVAVLAPGFYFIRIGWNGGRESNLKFIKH